ncbi:MAG: HAD-IIA family hydrolase [Ruminococcaceae bacterium]|nr:HAD-IIA family hydrolase [Oscillospiraceae bacterium]
MQTDIKDIELFLFDMDGTLYLGNQLFSFTKVLLRTIREKGKRYLFMTNNSARSVVDYVAKLERLGIAATPDDFITSSQATIWYLQRHHAKAVLYVCGTESLKAELRGAGFAVTDDTEAATCIVIGNDTELTFKKLDDISRMLCTREMPYIATNPDWVCPTEYGSVPDCGSFCEMLYRATGKRPIFIGKPEALMPELAMERLGVPKERTAVVGDRIYTDIKSGINAGTVSILVMSGETTEEILEASADKPDLVLQDGSEIVNALLE